LVTSNVGLCYLISLRLYISLVFLLFKKVWTDWLDELRTKLHSHLRVKSTSIFMSGDDLIVTI